MNLNNYKVLELPPVGQPNSRYYLLLSNGTKTIEYITDKYGNYVEVVSTTTATSSYEEKTEALIGTLDGSNATFVTTYDFDPDTTIVYINGIKQTKPVHYNTVGTKTVIFSESPETVDILEINYKRL